MDTPAVSARLRGPTQIVHLAANAKVELADEDDGLFLAIHDDDVLVLIELPRDAGAWLKSKSLARRIEGLEPEIRAKTIGYSPEHNAHTGPGAYRPIPRPLGPALMQQDPPGWT